MGFLCYLALLGNLCAFANDADMKSYPSLFFKREEMARLHEERQKPSGEPSLSAILYYDENHWSVWINNKIIHPDNMQELEAFHIETVFLQGVVISRPSLDGEEKETLTLYPY